MRYINVHTHSNPVEPGITAIVNQYPDEFMPTETYSIGIHPWRITPEKTDDWLRMVDRLALDTSCVAIGECGLDKRIETPLKEQIPVFESQWKIAVKNQKPVMIHCVAAYDEVIEIKRSLNLPVPAVIHGFSKNIQVATRLLDHGFHLSFGKYLLRNPELSGVFKMVPDDRIFLETDSISESIAEVYDVAARARNISVTSLKELIEVNFNTVFRVSRE